MTQTSAHSISIRGGIVSRWLPKSGITFHYNIGQGLVEAGSGVRPSLPRTRTLRRRRGQLGDTWYLDELFVTIKGRPQYLWRAVDEEGDMIDILVQARRDRHAAKRFFTTAC